MLGTEPGTQSELRRGKGREDQCWELDSVGSTENALLCILQEGVADQSSGDFMQWLQATVLLQCLKQAAVMFSLKKR